MSLPNRCMRVHSSLDSQRAIAAAAPAEHASAHHHNETESDGDGNGFGATKPATSGAVVRIGRTVVLRP